MKILFITQTDFNINLDIATWLEMSLALAKKGCEVEIVIPPFNSPPQLKDKRVVYVFLSYPRDRFAPSFFFQLSLFFYSLKKILSKECDLFLVDSFTVLTLLPLAFFKKMGIINQKFVLDIRSVPVDTYGIKGKINKIRFNLAIYMAKYFFDGITVITDLYLKKISDDFNIEKEKMGVWTSGVSIEKFNPSFHFSKREELGLKGKFVVMYHGGITESRGIRNLVESVGILRKEMPDIMLLLVGRESGSGIRRLINDKNLSKNVLFIGAVSYDKIPEYISACDIGILPFPDSIWWRMSSPLKLYEYLAMGKPVILTNIETHRRFAKEVESVFLIEDNLPETIAKGIRKAHNIKDKLPEIGKKGIDLVKKKGTWKAQADTLLNYLKKL